MRNMSFKKQLLLILGIPFIFWFLLLTVLTFYGINHFFSINNLLSPSSTEVSTVSPTTVHLTNGNIKEGIVVNLEKTTNNFWYFYIPLILFFITTGIMGMSKIINHLLTPLKNLESKVTAINIEDISSDWQTNLSKKPAEIITLENSFRELLLRLKASFDKQGRFVNNAAHELRTPLSIIKTSLQLIKMEEEPSLEDYRETYEMIENNSYKMENIINSLLYLATNNTSIKKEAIQLKPLLLEIEKDILLLYPHLKITLLFDSNLKIQVNKIMFKRIIFNLLENSGKYGAQNVVIKVTLDKSNHLIHIIFEDDGVGIPEEKLKYVKEPFYRVDDSRSKQTEGYGLGLSLVEEMMLSHEGKFSIENGVQQGIVIRLTFPYITAQTTIY